MVYNVKKFDYAYYFQFLYFYCSLQIGYMNMKNRKKKENREEK